MPDLMTIDKAMPRPVFGDKDQRRREILAAWLAGLSPNTHRAYAADVSAFSEWLGFEDPVDATDWFFALESGDANLTALRYVQDLREKGLSTATVARRLNSLKSLARCSRMIGASSWLIEVRAPEPEAYRDTAGPDPIAWEKIKRAIAADDSDLGKRNQAIILMAREMGLRRNEIASLDLEHVVQESGTEHGIAYRHIIALNVMGKARQSRERLTVPRAVGAALVAWLERRGDQPGPLVHRLDRAWDGQPERLSGQAILDVVAKVSRSAGLGRAARPHGLRHSGITAAWRATRDALAVKKFARHARFDVTERYIDNAEDEFGRVAGIISE